MDMGNGLLETESTKNFTWRWNCQEEKEKLFTLGKWQREELLYNLLTKN